MKQGRNCNARLVVLSQPSRNLRHSLARRGKLASHKQQLHMAFKQHAPCAR